MFYPRLCVACGNALQQNETLICLKCLLHLPETNYHTQSDNPLNLIFAGRVKVEQVAALLFFRKDDRVQHILHHLKYRGCKEVGAFLGEYYGQKLRTIAAFQSVDAIVPVPLHPRKKRRRGYNQSEWIAMGLGRGMQKPLQTDVIVRTRFSETQTKKGRFSRWENVKEVFRLVNGEAIAGKHLLVCDDVLTTGATMEAVTKELLRAEGVKVSVVTLATTFDG